MKKRLQSLFLPCLVIVLGCLFHLSPSFASTTTEIYREDFSGGGMPDGWSGDFSYWGWTWASNGAGDENGSLATNGINWNTSTQTMFSPTFDASAYSQVGDTLLLDFDVFLEEYYWDWYERVNFGEDRFWARPTLTIKATSSNGTTTLIKLDIYEAFTSPLNQDIEYAGAWDQPNPYTTESSWKHIQVGIPAEQRTSDLRISFSHNIGGDADGTQAIDNIVLTGTHKEKINFDHTSLNFGSIGQYNRSATQCIEITNPNPRPVNIWNVHVVGSNVEDFRIESAPTVVEANGTAEICASFAPLSKDLRQALIEFNTDADDQDVVDFDMRGVGLMPFIESDVANLFRGTRTRFDESRLAALPIKNSGAVPLQISNTSFIDGDWPEEYSIVSLPESIGPNSVDTAWISYRPHYEGAHPAVLHILSNSVNGPLVIELRGVGVLPRLQLSPSPLAFDSVGVGDTLCRIVTLYNPGTDTLQLKQQYLSSADADFTFTPMDSKDMIIPPEKSKQVMVCFHPLRNGTRIAKLRTTTNIPLTFEEPRRDTSEFVLDIKGIGVPFGALVFDDGAYSDSTLIGTQVCHSSVIKNNGQSDLVITSGSLSGANMSEFTVSGINYPLTLKPGEQQTVTVCSTPAARGTRNATLDLRATTADSTIIKHLPLDVYGELACAEPDQQSLFTTATALGMNETKSVTISNCGDVAEVFTLAISGSTNYQIGGVTTTASIPAGGTVTIPVTYTPVICGDEQATLTATGSVGVVVIPVTLNGSSDGVTYKADVPTDVVSTVNTPKDFTITLHNISAYPWTPGVATFTGPFTMTAAVTTPIAPGATQDVTVTFTPTVEGTSAGTMSFPQGMPKECSLSQVALSGTVANSGVRSTASASGYTLEQNYPNPFNPTTLIRFSMPSTEVVRLVISNVKGEVIRTVLNERLTAGEHSIIFDASDLASGTYFYSLVSGTTTITRQMMLVK